MKLDSFFNLVRMEGQRGAYCIDGFSTEKISGAFFRLVSEEDKQAFKDYENMDLEDLYEVLDELIGKYEDKLSNIAEELNLDLDFVYFV